MLTGFRSSITAFMVLIAVFGLTAWTAAAQSGKQDYDAYCADCHGPGGKGNGPSTLTIDEPASVRPHPAVQKK